jgi:diguanylate cyclase (GGDEF)-like protein
MLTLESFIHAMKLIPIPMILIQNKHVIATNCAFKLLAGLTSESIEQFQLDGLFSSEIPNKKNCHFLIQKSKHHIPVRLKRISIKLQKHEVLMYELLIIQDQSELFQMELNLKSIADHDPVTHLMGRRLFQERVEHAIQLSKRTKSMMAMMYLDLDNFKNVNDQFGHTTGDECLRNIANKILTCIRETDCFTRLGGDEFVVFVLNLKNTQDVDIIARKILAKIREPIFIPPHQLHLTVSLGIAWYQFGDDFYSLLQKADEAMYDVKHSTKNDYQTHR